MTNYLIDMKVYEQSKPAMRASFGHQERPAYQDNRPTVEKVRREWGH